ncbi:MAG: HD family phosphohydrolase [Coleofasciculaceae cyanobacterium]
MKTLHSLTEPLTQLRRKSEHIRAWLSLRVSDSSATNETQQGGLPTKPHLKLTSPFQGSASNPSPTSSRVKGEGKRRKNQPLMLVVAVVSLTGVIGNRFYDQPQLSVGTKAPQKILAPSDAKVIDEKTTEEKRQAARSGLFPILKIDRSVTEKITQELEQSLDRTEELRKVSGSFPFVDTAVLSDSTQNYLRQTQETEWLVILAELEKKEQDADQLEQDADQLEPSLAQPEQVEEPFNLDFANAVSELQSYRQLSSPQDFSNLIELIEQARQGYAQATNQLKQPLRTQATPQTSSLLDISDQAWQETREGTMEAARRILTQGIPPGLPDNLLKEVVTMHLSSLVPPETRALATQLLASALEPNLAEDKEQTKNRAEQAAQSVETVYYSVREGEVIVQAGEAISQEDFILLDNFGLSRRGINWPGLLGFSCIVTGAVGVFWLVEKQAHSGLRRRDHILILLLALSTPVLISFSVPYTSLPAVGLLVGSFYGTALGVTAISLLTGLVGLSMEISWVTFLSGAAGGLLAALIAGRLRSREELALLGGGVGLTEGGVYLIISLIVSASPASVWYSVLKEAALYSFAGLSWSIVALGISPYLERLFDLITPIRLAELSNPNRPLLKRLATEAPGTFQHTLFVASLAEAAAREIHCNVELVRAGTLYHDIGKMHDPLGFIENQMGGPNKHDEINNPWKSAEIIKKHVSEGLVMARKHQLPKAIRDFIPEHQGKLLISYFYFQAKQKAELEGLSPIEESDFRYDGPAPQSRETAVVMLADACEAALRSLQDVTPETALTMVNKILKARWQDDQLVDSGLTREDLSTIAKVFVRVWQQYNHKRIAYPKAALNCQPSAK